MRRQIKPDELEYLYRAIGRAVWTIQYLEDVLHTFLTMKIDLRHPGRVSETEARELLAKHRRASLGTAIGTAERANALPAYLLEELRALKEERDWMIHRSMNQDGDSLYTDHGRSSLLERVDSVHRVALELKAKVMQEVDAFCASHGVSPQEAEANARAQIAKLRGEA